MANDNKQNINMLSLTDCLYFPNGNCMFKNKCRYRHCETAVKQLEKCPKWPESCRNINCPYRHIGTLPKILKPLTQDKNLVSVFWDIENIPISKDQKPFDIVQRIRQKIIIECGLQEADFSCYGNINKISEEHQKNLHHATVRIVHVPDPKPGAINRQIMLELDRFGRTHQSPATIVLISDDINFVGKLNDLRYRAGFHVINIHNKPVEEVLIATVNAHYSWELFVESIKQQQPSVGQNSETLTNQSTNFRPVLSNRLANVSNTNHLVLPNFMKLPSPVVSGSHDENDHCQKNVIQSNFSSNHRRSRSVNRNCRQSNNTPPQAPPSVNQTSSSNVGCNTLPSAATPIVAPRARIRYASSSTQLDRQNFSTIAPYEQTSSTFNDDIGIKQRNSLPCPFCTNEFGTIQALRQHQKDKNHLYYCAECKEGFPTSNGVRQHQISKGHNISNHMNTNKD